MHFPIETGELLSVKRAVKNTGKKRFDNRALKTGSPLNWTMSVQPHLIPELDAGNEPEFDLLAQTTADAGARDMNVILRAETMADNRRAGSNDRHIRIPVETSVNV